jgi:long-chain acyl-CoA synthetase
MWRFADYSNNVAAFCESGEAVTYSCLEQETDSLIHNISEGRCLVFSLCSNELASLIGYVAFINNHIVPFMLDADIETKFLFALIDIYKPAYLWLPEEKTSSFFNYKKVYSKYGYVLLKTGIFESDILHNDLALLLTTSGSTGSSKFVRLSYNNIRSNIESIVEYLEMGESSRNITTLPMNYSYGISILNTHLYVGASIILTNKNLFQKEFWQKIKELKATNFGGVPYTYEMLRRLHIFNMDLPSLKYMTQAGGRLSSELCLEYARGCRAIDKDFIVMYGATEATARMSYLPRNMAVEKAGSIGIAIPRGRFELIDDNGDLICESEKVGELVYYGDNVSLGYAEKAEDLSKPDERFGRLETGDMARRDSEGCYYIVGRKKRFLKLYGNRVNLAEVEELLIQQGYESACVGSDDHMRIYITNDDTEKVLNYISSVTGINRKAFEVLKIEKIPRNSSGKVLYSELQVRD